MYFVPGYLCSRHMEALFYYWLVVIAVAMNNSLRRLVFSVDNATTPKIDSVVACYSDSHACIGLIISDLNFHDIISW